VKKIRSGTLTRKSALCRPVLPKSATRHTMNIGRQLCGELLIKIVMSRNGDFPQSPTPPFRILIFTGFEAPRRGML
jgi:hypothetical protein